MTIRLVATLCALAIYLAGCATPYSPPKDGPTATLLLNGIPAPTIGKGNLKALGGQADFVLINDLVTCKDDVFLAHGLEAGQSKSIQVGAGRPIAIKYFYRQWLPMAYCERFILFNPESGVTYSLRFDENSLLKGQCMPKLEKRTSDGGQFSKVPFFPVCTHKK